MIDWLVSMQHFDVNWRKTFINGFTNERWKMTALVLVGRENFQGF